MVGYLSDRDIPTLCVGSRQVHSTTGEYIVMYILSVTAVQIGAQVWQNPTRTLTGGFGNVIQQYMLSSNIPAAGNFIIQFPTNYSGMVTFAGNSAVGTGTGFVRIVYPGTNYQVFSFAAGVYFDRTMPMISQVEIIIYNQDATNTLTAVSFGWYMI
jgi:hypothetical protein